MLFYGYQDKRRSAMLNAGMRLKYELKVYELKVDIYAQWLMVRTLGQLIDAAVNDTVSN